MLGAPRPELLKTKLNIHVPFAIIAAATGQQHLVPSLAGKQCFPSVVVQPTHRVQARSKIADANSTDGNVLISESEKNPIDISSESEDDNEVDISEVRPVKRQCLAFVDLTGDEDIL